MKLQRDDITFQSADTTCAAWLYRPLSETPAPLIIMAHGLGGVRSMRLDAFAERFCAAGYACLVFDYRHFGASGGVPRQLLSIRRQLQDWQAAVHWAQADTRVDGDRIVLWGTSFSGGHVLVTAAANPAITAVISQCPFTHGLASSLALHPLSSLKVGIRALRDIATIPFGAEPVPVDLAGPPGGAALMTAPDAEPGYNALKPQALKPNAPGTAEIKGYVAARFGLAISAYFPGRSARQVTCPTLLLACLQDTVAPVNPTLKYAGQLVRGQVEKLDCGHFDIYVGEWFERVVALELAFLQRHVPVGTTTAATEPLGVTEQSDQHSLV